MDDYTNSPDSNSNSRNSTRKTEKEDTNLVGEKTTVSFSLHDVESYSVNNRFDKFINSDSSDDSDLLYSWRETMCTPDAYLFVRKVRLCCVTQRARVLCTQVCRSQ